MSAPFENSYRLRKVAPADSKACFICYKPTECVLITPDQKDFFYTCSNHLKDTKTFCTPVYGPEVDKTREEIKIKQDRRKVLEFLIKEKTKFSPWSKIMGEKDKAADKDASSGDKNKSVEDYKKESREILKEISELEQRMESLKGDTKQFILHKDIYKMRVSGVRKKLTAQKRADKIQSGALFPSVPNDQL